MNVVRWELNSRVAGNKETLAAGSHLGDTMETEQEKPRSSKEEQRGRTLGHGVQEK